MANKYILLIGLIGLLFVRMISARIYMTEYITPNETLMCLHYNTSAEGKMINDFIPDIVGIMNSALDDYNSPYAEEYEELETIYLEDNCEDDL